MLRMHRTTVVWLFYYDTDDDLATNDASRGRCVRV